MKSDFMREKSTDGTDQKLAVIITTSPIPRKPRRPVRTDVQFSTGRIPHHLHFYKSDPF